MESICCMKIASCSGQKMELTNAKAPQNMAFFNKPKSYEKKDFSTYEVKEEQEFTDMEKIIVLFEQYKFYVEVTNIFSIQTYAFWSTVLAIL